MILIPSKGWIALLFAAAALSACQGAKEMHYFKQGDNYYRVRIREKALFTSSRYQSGFFDEAAVDNYFSEIRQPKSVAIERKGQAMQRIDADGSIRPPEQTKFVIILSSNSKAISDQIGGLAENEQIFALLSKMASKTAGNAVSSATNIVAGTTEDAASAIARQAENAVFKTDPAKTTSDAELLDLINNIVKLRYPGVQTFKSLPAAREWYQNIRR